MADAADGGKVLEAYRCVPVDADNVPEVGDLVEVTGKLTKFGTTPEFAAGGSVTIIEKGGGGEEPPVVTDPTNCAEAAAAALSVSEDNEEYNGGKEYTIRGYVTVTLGKSTDYETYGNVSFWMADAADGGKVLEAYRCVPVDADNVPEVGDLVEVTGKLTKFGTTPEFAAGGSVTIIEKGGGGEEPPVVEVPTTCAEAREAILALADGAYLLNKAEITLQGYVTEIVTEYSEQYGNISFWMADEEDGGQVIQAYRAKCDADAIPVVGDYVKVVGMMKKYVKNGEATPEFDAGCTVTIIDGGGGEEPDYTYDWEPTEISNINATFKSIAIEDYTADGGVIWIILIDNEEGDIETAEQWAILEAVVPVYNESVGFAALAGTYPINDSGSMATFTASPGGDDESDYPCYFAMMVDEESWVPYYLVSGSVTISPDGKLVVDAKSYNGSTIVLTYQYSPSTDVDNTAVDGGVTKTMQNGQLFINRNGRTYNVMGARVK